MRRAVGRYLVLDRLASGGMGTVHLGRLTAQGGFSRWVAIKVLHEQYARDPAFRAMFLDEARIVSHIRHANVVSTLDVLEDEGELFLIMDYVDGLPLSQVMTRVFQRGDAIPIDVAVAIVCDALEGLHAAHEARSDTGEPYRIVHRDVSPQNIMLGRDGVARILDFGIAHAAGRSHETQPGEVKGKPSYMAPEQARGLEVDARTDVYPAAIVLWELLTGERLFAGSTFAESLLRQLEMQPDPPSTRRPEVSPELDAVVLRGLAKQPSSRFDSAIEMARALESATRRGHHADVARFVQGDAAEFFEERGVLLARISAAEDATGLTVPDRPGGAEGPQTERPAEEANMTTRGTLTAPPPRRRSRGPTLALIGLGAGAALAFATRAVWAPHPKSPPRVADMAESALAEPAEGSPEPVASASIAPSTPTATPSALPSAHHPPSVEPRAVARSNVPPAPRAAPSAPRVAPLPACCVGSIHVLFSGCANNCPP